MGYAEAWQERRRLQRNLLGWLFGGPVLVFLFKAVGPVMPGRWFDGFIPLVGSMWGVGTFLWAGRLLHGFYCPRCRKLFYLQGLRGNALTGRCLHCGLFANAAEPFAPSAGTAPLRLPLFIGGKDLHVFTSVQAAELHLMREDVWADEGFDSAGMRLQFQQWTRWGLLGWTSERVCLEQGEAQPSGQARLRELLGARLQSRGTSREWLGRASLDELVHEAARVLAAK